MMSDFAHSRICVVGMGYVGLTLSIHAAKMGYLVDGIEADKARCESLNAGKADFFEPGLNDSLIKCLNERKLAIHQTPRIDHYDFVVISVGSPLTLDSTDPNLDHLDRAIKSVLSLLSETTVLILRSTIPVGTTSSIATSVAKLVGRQCHISFAPERTAEGRALIELSTLPQIYAANTDFASAQCKKFFASLSPEVIEVDSLEAAELIKLFNNVYRDANFALGNLFNLIAQSYGLNGAKVLEWCNSKYDRCNIALPGFTRGPCLEKDPYILTYNLKDSVLKNHVISAREVNLFLELKFSRIIKRKLTEDKKNRILISGLAFKGHPATNDLRGSSACQVITMIAGAGFDERIVLHDFMNDKNVLEQNFNLKAINSDAGTLAAALSEFSHLIIMNNHESYKNEQLLNEIENFIDSGGELIDCWNVILSTKSSTLCDIFID